jgi:hypothetical protein
MIPTYDDTAIQPNGPPKRGAEITAEATPAPPPWPPEGATKSLHRSWLAKVGRFGLWVAAGMACGLVGSTLCIVSPLGSAGGLPIGLSSSSQAFGALILGLVIGGAAGLAAAIGRPPKRRGGA